MAAALAEQAVCRQLTATDCPGGKKGCSSVEGFQRGTPQDQYAHRVAVKSSFGRYRTKQENGTEEKKIW